MNFFFFFQSDTVRVIWAIHDKDPRNEYDLVYHSEKRGAQSVHLLGPPPIERGESMPPTRHWDVTLDKVSYTLHPIVFIAKIS